MDDSTKHEKTSGSASPPCGHCGKPGHLEIKCKLKTLCSYCDNFGHHESKCRLKTVCSYCGKLGHHESICKLKTVCSHCKKRGHHEGKCKLKLVCSHCGRSGHIDTRCRDIHPELEKATKTKKSPLAIQQFTVSPGLAGMETMNAQTYLDLNDVIEKVVASAFIYQDRAVLLLERARWRPSQAVVWELPGGLCDKTDVSLLHSAARETLEEIGLRIKHFNHQIGDGFVFEARHGTQMFGKVVFDARVAESVEENGGSSRIPYHAFRLSREHSRWIWATEEQVRAERVGEIEVSLMPVEKQILLEGFAIRKTAETFEDDEGIDMEDDRRAAEMAEMF